MVTWTEEDLRNYERKRKSFTTTHGEFNPKTCIVAPKLPDPIPEQTSWSKSVQSDEVKEGSQGRIKVRITRFGVHLLDPDNTAGCKLVIDELRAAKLIPSDDPYCIELEICQIKAPKEMRGTLIEIIP